MEGSTRDSEKNFPSNLFDERMPVKRATPRGKGNVEASNKANDSQPGDGKSEERGEPTNVDEQIEVGHSCQILFASRAGIISPSPGPRSRLRL